MKKYDNEVLFFIENRTDQHIQNGENVKDFWDYFTSNYLDLARKTGIILDIQQLYTVTKENFKSQLKMIPKESLHGLHIHERHKPPKYKYISEDNWNYVSNELCNIKFYNRPFHILPEVNHAKHVEETYVFCKEVLKL